MAQKTKRISKIDEEVEETFPASDPPAFMAGSLGAPKGRNTASPHKKPKKRKATAGKARAVAKPQSKRAKRKQAGTKRGKSR